LEALRLYTILYTFSLLFSPFFLRERERETGEKKESERGEKRKRGKERKKERQGEKERETALKIQKRTFITIDFY